MPGSAWPQRGRRRTGASYGRVPLARATARSRATPRRGAGCARPSVCRRIDRRAAPAGPKPGRHRTDCACTMAAPARASTRKTLRATRARRLGDTDMETPPGRDRRERAQYPILARVGRFSQARMVVLRFRHAPVRTAASATSGSTGKPNRAAVDQPMRAAAPVAPRASRRARGPRIRRDSPSDALRSEVEDDIAAFRLRRAPRRCSRGTTGFLRELPAAFNRV